MKHNCVGPGDCLENVLFFSAPDTSGDQILNKDRFLYIDELALFVANFVSVFKISVFYPTLTFYNITELKTSLKL